MTTTTPTTFSPKQIAYLNRALWQSASEPRRWALLAEQAETERRTAAARERSDNGSHTPAAAVPPSVEIGQPLTMSTSDAEFLACTRGHESVNAGLYQAYNPAGPYYGAYQFLQSTWDNTARHAGRTDLVGVDPRNTSPADQDALALDLYHWQGKGPWGGRC